MSLNFCDRVYTFISVYFNNDSLGHLQWPPIISFLKKIWSHQTKIAAEHLLWSKPIWHQSTCYDDNQNGHRPSAIMSTRMGRRVPAMTSFPRMRRTWGQTDPYTSQTAGIPGYRHKQVVNDWLLSLTKLRHISNSFFLYMFLKIKIIIFYLLFNIWWKPGLLCFRSSDGSELSVLA